MPQSEAVTVNPEMPVDPATINTADMPPPPEVAKPKAAEEEKPKPENEPLTDEEAAAIRRAAIVGFYAEDYELAGRTYTLRTMTAASNKKWKAQHVLTIATYRKMYAELPVSETGFEAMASDENVQRFVAYQVAEIDHEPLSYEQALTHVEKMSPIERGVLHLLVQNNAAKAELLYVRSMKNKLKKS